MQSVDLKKGIGLTTVTFYTKRKNRYNLKLRNIFNFNLPRIIFLMNISISENNIYLKMKTGLSLNKKKPMYLFLDHLLKNIMLYEYDK